MTSEAQPAESSDFSTIFNLERMTAQDIATLNATLQARRWGDATNYEEGDSSGTTSLAEALENDLKFLPVGNLQKAREVFGALATSEVSRNRETASSYMDCLVIAEETNGESIKDHTKTEEALRLWALLLADDEHDVWDAANRNAYDAIRQGRINPAISAWLFMLSVKFSHRDVT